MRLRNDARPLRRIRDEGLWLPKDYNPALRLLGRGYSTCEAHKYLLALADVTNTTRWRNRYQSMQFCIEILISISADGHFRHLVCLLIRGHTDFHPYDKAAGRLRELPVASASFVPHYRVGPIECTRARRIFLFTYWRYGDEAKNSFRWCWVPRPSSDCPW